MLKSQHDGVSRDFSSEDDSIVHLVTSASEDSALLLSLLKTYRRQDVNSTLIKCVDSWIVSQRNFHIPSPVALIKAWVRIQCELTDGKEHAAPTIYSLVPSLRDQKHKKQSGIIFEQERLEYRVRMEMGNGSLQLCKMMEKSIKKTISELKTREELLSTSQYILTCGIMLGSCGQQSLTDCIEYIKEGINLLVKRENGKGLRHDEKCFIIKGYLFIALFQRTAYPRRKNSFTQAIEIALSYWRKTKKLKLSEIDSKLFFSVAHLLSLEGEMELQSELYNLLIGCFKYFERKLEDLLGMVLQSGNMCHSLCSLPVDDAFIKVFSKHLSSSSNVSFWKSCATSKKSGIDKIFSVFPTLRSTSSLNDAHATKAQETIHELKCTASNLITTVSESDNPYADAHIHYNLSERLFANGLHTEALYYAKEAYLLRDKLLSEHFIIEWDEKIEIKKFAYKI